MIEGTMGDKPQTTICPSSVVRGPLSLREPSMKERQPFQYHTTGLLLAVLYGVIVAQIFAEDIFSLEAISWSSVMLIPYAVGAATLYYYTRNDEDRSLWFALIMPLIACLGVFGVIVALSFGMLFCIIISLPIFLPPASLGGISVWLIRRNKKMMSVFLTFALFAPLVGGTVEAQIVNPRMLTTTHTSIQIDASVEDVWNNIKSVSPITSAEQSFNWLHVMGLPQPIAATLSHEGVGGVRDATFANGLRFDETITEWEHHKLIRFDIVETSEELLPRPLDLIDGETFDVVEGVYEIEQLEDGTVILHLTSEHYLSTRFNKYGSYWTDLTMRNLQNYILEIVKTRVEG